MLWPTFIAEHSRNGQLILTTFNLPSPLTQMANMPTMPYNEGSHQTLWDQHYYLKHLYLFIKLCDTKARENPGAWRWKNLIVSKVDPLLYIGSICLCFASELIISNWKRTKLWVKIMCSILNNQIHWTICVFLQPIIHSQFLLHVITWSDKKKQTNRGWAYWKPNDP